MQKYSDVVLDKNGNGIAGLTVTIKTHPDGQPATIYAYDGGPAVDSVKTDPTGRFAFYAANGKYKGYTNGAGVTPGEFGEIQLFDPADDNTSTLQVSDYASLRAYAGPRKSVYVTGYLGTSAPSGIAGMFVRDDADTTSADNGGTIILAANGKRWKRSYAGTPSIKWFGAACDGVTNDTAAWNAARAASYEIHFPQGTCLIDPVAGGYNINLYTLSGDGPYKSIVKMSGTNTADVLFRNGTTDINAAWGIGAGNINIRNLQIQGNWDGASGQTTITPPSGNGNGIVGLRYAEYNQTTNGALLQLFSASRVFLDNVWMSNGYGHGIVINKIGYSRFAVGRSFAFRGSGFYIDAPSASSANTSFPITSWNFETCRGEYGGLFGHHLWGTAIKFCMFEGQPYGIYLLESGDVATGGNYYESHYYEDFHKDPTCWGITDEGSYLYAQQPWADISKGHIQYNRAFGYNADTDNTTYGKRNYLVNGNYIQRDVVGIGVNPALPSGSAQLFLHKRKQLASAGSASLGMYNALRVDARSTDAAGAAEIRFRHNLNKDSRSAISFATTASSAEPTDRWRVEYNGFLLPESDNAYSIGSPTLRPNAIYSVNVTLTPPSSVTPVNNGEVMFQKTSDTQLAIKVKGSDGVVRSATLTLA